MNNKYKYLITTLIILSTIFTYILFSPNYNNYKTENVFFKNSNNDLIFSSIYIPFNIKKPNEKFPAIITVHASNQEREFLQPYAITLAKNGITVMEIILKRTDNNGHVRAIEDYLVDINSAINYLLSRPEINHNNIFLGGHSIGANLTSMVGAINSDTKGVIATGYPVEFPAKSDVTFFLNSGILDQLHNPAKIQKAFKNSLVVDEKQSLLRRYLLHSFLSDHILEPADPYLTHSAINFIKKSINNNTTGYINFIAIIILRSVLFISLFFFYAYFLIQIFAKYKFENNNIKRLFLGLFGVIFIIATFLYKGSEDLIPVYYLSSLFFALLITNFFFLKLKNREIEGTKEIVRVFIKDVKKILILSGFLYLTYIIGLFFHSLFFPVSSPLLTLKSILGLPYLAVGHLFTIITRFNSIFLNPNLSLNIFPLTIFIIFIAELIYPGITFKIIDDLTSSIIKGLQNLDFKIKWNFNLSSIIVLIITIIIALIYWNYILKEGYIFEKDEVIGLSFLLFCFLFIPGYLFTLTIRSKFFKKLLENNTFKG